jgi:hypothetical protein
MALNSFRERRTPRGCVNETASAQDYCVEQGPDWLAALLVDPPMITYVVAGVLVLGVIGLVVAAHRRDPLDRHDAREMLASIAIVGGCGLGAWVFKELAIAGYLVDVLGGWAVGGGVGMLAARQIREADDPQGEDSDQQVRS